MLMASFCPVKECWQCYVRHRERAGLVAKIRDQMTMEMHPMILVGGGELILIWLRQLLMRILRQFSNKISDVK